MKIIRRATKITLLTVLCVGILFTSGCGGSEPEEREYPLALAWDCQDENYTIIYSMADLPEVTGQDKESGENIPGVELTGSSIEELNKKYVESQQYELDLGHVQAVIFSEALYRNEEQFEKICEAMRQDSVLGKNAYVFVTQDIHALMQLDGSQGGSSMGEYLTGLYENHPGQEEKSVTLEDIFYSMENYEKEGRIPVLLVEQDQIRLDRTGAL